MIEQKPIRNPDEHRQRADEIFNRVIRAQVEDENPRKFLMIDLESGDFEIDAVEAAAGERLLARRPDARIWGRRVGSPHARRFGGSS